MGDMMQRHSRRMMVLGLVLFGTTVTATLLGAASGAMPPAGAPAVRHDSAAAVATVERFHAALARGDSATVLSLLADGATILESGGAETVAEYRGHHLPADIEHARAVASVRSLTRVAVRGDVAWVAGTSTSEGTVRGRAVKSSGAELMVLTHAADGWRIAAIHWSSRTRR